jgi:tight adherence protein B
MTTVPAAVLVLWALSAAVRRPSRSTRVAAGAAAARWPRSVAVAGRDSARGAVGWWRGRRAEVGLPEAVDAVAAAVGAGRSLADGLAAAAAGSPPLLAAELDEVVATIGRGLPTSTAVARWAERSSVDGVPLVAAAIALAGDAGGNVEHALAGVGATLRERRALTREIRALSSQARASAGTIAAAPLAFGSLAVLADGDTARFLVGSPGGLACLSVGLLLDLAGFRWMRRLAGQVS